MPNYKFVTCKSYDVFAIRVIRLIQ
uniref:Uncharacterized protein n=1 Tax=Rhizophora mucronata TaxID=61149 RepID=A0A2P2M816_RHIMU